jgi:hypothetical protein
MFNYTVEKWNNMANITTNKGGFNLKIVEQHKRIWFNSETNELKTEIRKQGKWTVITLEVLT